MLPRERVLTSLNGKKPDRTPVDFWAEPCVEERLLKDLKMGGTDELLDYMEVDIRSIWAGEPPYKYTADDKRENYWGERFQKVNHMGYEEWVHLPGALVEAETLKDLKKFDWPSPDWLDYGVLKEQVKKYKGYAIRYGFGDVFTRPCAARGIENFLCDLAIRPDMGQFIIDKFADFYAEDVTRALEATDGQIDILLLLSDLGTQNGPLISMDMFNTYVAPAIKKVFSPARSAGVKTLFHSCGAVRKFIPSLIDAGMDILNPIQVGAAGMVPPELKKEFGDRISFHGGIDVQSTLPNGTPEDVQNEVRQRIRELGHNGGYIICATHNLQIDTSTANIKAMYDVNIR